MKFKNFNGEPVEILEEVEKLLKEYNLKIYIGTDSFIDNKSKKVCYATVVVLHKENKGGRVFISKKHDRLANSLKERLHYETWQTLTIAYKLSERFKDKAEIIIHIDVNKSRKHKSGDYVQELVGLITGQGFKCFVKPDSWAAQTVADKFTR